jgi:diguanylate cyclase (GGDEF)-like protein
MLISDDLRRPTEAVITMLSFDPCKRLQIWVIVALSLVGWGYSLRLAACGALLGAAVLVARRTSRDEVLEGLAASIREHRNSGDWTALPPFEDSDAAEIVASFQELAVRLREHEQHVRHFRHIAHFDLLTGLPNRTLFDDRLERSVSVGRRRHHSLAVLLVEIERYGEVVRSLGATAGESLVQIVAERLTKTLRDEDTVARNGRCEFLVLLPQLNVSSDAVVVASKILSGVNGPANIEGVAVHLSVRAGISIFPDDGLDAEGLIDRAHAALHQSGPAAGGGSIQAYARSAQFMRPSLMVENSIRRGLERGEFSLVYQRSIDLRTERIAGLEALIRWNHPQLGVLAPPAFIPVAEQTQLIAPLGAWVLRETCIQMGRWMDAGLEVPRLAINLSVVQLRDPDLVATIERTIRDYGVDPSRLELELTETALMDDFAGCCAVLKALRGLGFGVAIDDFGTGYSSFRYLQNLPASALKIDRSFVRDLTIGSNSAAALLDLMIGVGRSLGLRVVAEGVEEPQQLDVLREHGCDEAQGFLFGQPEAAREIARWLDPFEMRVANR